MRPTIKTLLKAEGRIDNIEVFGWLKSKRETKSAVFLSINDGSTFGNLQCVIDALAAESMASVLTDATTGASIRVTGSLEESPAAGQRFEVKVKDLTIIGKSAADYPLQKKNHSFEFLRTVAHLRPRTNTFGAICRLRNAMAFATHQFFQANEFKYVHTPIITTSDSEGAGAMFRVTTLDPAKHPHDKTAPDFSEDFFGKAAFLTVSGQLNVEAYCQAMSRVYTFGPTFRAENSNTSRHLAEFWMIEPEAAFFDLEDNMALAEDFLKTLFKSALEDCADDLEFFDSRIQNGLVDMISQACSSSFTKMSYTDAIRELQKKSDTFEFRPDWGCDLMSEHERFLTEEVAHGPVIVKDYPKEIKAFYMKLNDDGKTVRAMDVLVPRFGEIIGGSQREERLDVLTLRMKELNLPLEPYSWYLDLRRFGSTPHSGFGLGFERLLLYLSGMANIRDVIPFPRAPRLADF